MNNPKSGTLITLTTCDTSFEANLIKGMLKNNGIECILTNEIYTDLSPKGYLGSGVQVQIDESIYSVFLDNYH